MVVIAISMVLVCVIVFQYAKISEIQALQSELASEFTEVETQREELEEAENYLDENMQEYSEDYAREQGWIDENETKFVS